jgi:hypothetical protein
MKHCGDKNLREDLLTNLPRARSPMKHECHMHLVKLRFVGREGEERVVRLSSEGVGTTKLVS